MTLTVDQAKDNELNWADFIDRLRFGTLQRAACKGASKPAPTGAAAPARDAHSPQLPPDSRSG